METSLFILLSPLLVVASKWKQSYPVMIFNRMNASAVMKLKTVRVCGSVDVCVIRT